MDLVKILYPDMAPLSDTEITTEAWELTSDLQYGVFQRLCWLGLLYEAREGLTLLQTDPSTRRDFGAACLQLESDAQSDVGVH